MKTKAPITCHVALLPTKRLCVCTTHFDAAVVPPAGTRETGER